MIKHERTHTGDKPYQSLNAICAGSISRKSTTNTHAMHTQEMTHTGEKPYKSDYPVLWGAFLGEEHLDNA